MSVRDTRSKRLGSPSLNTGQEAQQRPSPPHPAQHTGEFAAPLPSDQAGGNAAAAAWPYGHLPGIFRQPDIELAAAGIVLTDPPPAATRHKAPPVLPAAKEQNDEAMFDETDHERVTANFERATMDAIEN